MGKYHIAVYAICKNERKFAARWMESMSEADGIYVLDTGSEDGTPELLEELGAKVAVERIEPWRFEAARNRSLELVPEEADLCVCTDLDEVFLPGWREALEAHWNPGFDQVRYSYIWNFLPDGSDGVTFWIDKIHRRRGFRWVNPVHEVLKMEGGVPNAVFVPEMRLEHHPDEGKSRGQYLPLLELAVEEDPDNDRNMHYLGREYFFHREWARAADTLRRHLAMPSATWPEERCASMRYLARCCERMDRPEEAERWLLRACGEAPGTREPWMDLARYYYDRESWHGVIFCAKKALSITEREGTYLTEPEAWGEAPYDLLAIALYYTGDYLHALAMEEEALKRKPMETRLRENLRLIRSRALNM